jgi:hypothetical protein
VHIGRGHVRRDKRAFLIAGRQSILHDAQHYLEGRVALSSSAIADFQRL